VLVSERPHRPFDPKRFRAYERKLFQTARVLRMNRRQRQRFFVGVFRLLDKGHHFEWSEVYALGGMGVTFRVEE
jgi:hypothetical protein